jgi:tripartite motif-containing protein 58
MVLAYLPKQVKLEMALELVRKEIEETLSQEVNVGKKTVVWKVRECGG